MATIAECDQVCRFISAAARARNQVMNVGFLALAFLTAGLADVTVAGEDNGSYFTPSAGLVLGCVV
ncbi:MAG TPA: hypothetical protein VJR92_11245 [Gemmatimonadaceae bacterium]|nr:hypothetical protein [Gemmatimonadaceae bacterium]